MPEKAVVDSKGSKWKIVSAFAAVWLLAVTICYFEVREELKVLNTARTAMEANISRLFSMQQEARQDILDLIPRVGRLEEDFNSTILRQRDELQSLRGEFQAMEDQLDSYFGWFKANSNLSPDLSKELSDIEDCAGATIRLPCIWFRNAVMYKIEYLNDSDIGKGDFIQPNNFTLSRGGGDCEDLATLFMAEANYLHGKFDRPFTTWTNSADGRFTIVGDWYLSGAETIEIEGSNVYVVCYSSESSGHCINAICNFNLTEDVKLGRDVDALLDDCYLIEPQNYAEMYWVNRSGNLTIGDRLYREPFLGWLLFMSSEDLCMDSNGTWQCFSNFRERMADFKERVDAILEQ